MRPPQLDPTSPDYHKALQSVLDLLWDELARARGVGGRVVRILGPLDISEHQVLGQVPQIPASHASRHQAGGVDQMNVSALTGLLADYQNPFLATAGVRGGAKMGDVFTTVAEVLTLLLKPAYGLEKTADGLAILKQNTVPLVATADASDLATAITLVNKLKAVLNDALTKLNAAQILASYTGYFGKGFFARTYFSDIYFREVHTT